jgi:7-cyano-7-deazaguanine synthase
MQAIVCHSGGMDSSICLAQAVQRFGADNVLAVAFDYGQRHKIELEQAKKICDFFAVQQRVVALDFMSHLTDNTLLGAGDIVHKNNAQPANSLVVGRNGLMLRLCAIIADNLGANFVYSGVTEVEAKYSGYRDSDQRYIDLLQNILRIDLANDDFEILTPVVGLTKAEGMQLAAKLGVLDFLLEHTISCYNGKIPGCQECPACCLRKQGIDEYYSAVN